jgi:dienelactone hydrolase
MKLSAAIFLFFVVAVAVRAEVIGLDIEYEHNGVKLQGYLAYDVADNSIRPGVLVFHEWWGLNDYAKQRAREIAEQGYIAFACDMYGTGVVANSRDEALKLVGPFYNDRKLMRERAAQGLWNLQNFSLCDKSKIAAIGYCFGGACALELARSGAELLGVVSFHGNLNTPNPEDAKNIKGSLLICHGANDPFVTQAEVAGFIEEMKGTDVDWQLIQYSGAVHAFTNPASGNDPSKGMAYNEKAEERSWEAMSDFLREVLRRR